MLSNVCFIARLDTCVNRPPQRITVEYQGLRSIITKHAIDNEREEDIGR